jgi:Zn-dependent M28 family amino/carboxypeptidase
MVRAMEGTGTRHKPRRLRAIPNKAHTLSRAVKLRMPRLAVAIMATLLAACTTAPPAPTTEAVPASVQPSVARAAEELRAAFGADEIALDLVALAEIADTNGGTRATGTSGYDASADYVAQRLADAGWDVERQEFSFPFFDDPATSTLAIEGDDATWAVGRDFRPLIYSAAGDVTAPVVVIDGGCDPDDFADLPDGAIALTTRGGCFRRQQVQNAQRAGAAAIVTATQQERDHVLRPTLLDPDGIEIPALGVSRDLTAALIAAAERGAELTLHVDVSTEERTATNVIGSSAGTHDGPTLMLGAHLDSVIDGPGINDNGSGSSLVLELARAIGERPHRSPIRVGFWAGEELGTLGSIHYVESLSPDEQDDVAIYLNFDMVGSPNAGRWVYSTDQSPIGRSTTQRFLDWFDEAGLTAEPLDLGGGSDHASFARAGIPTGGLFTGANERLTDEQASAFGGNAGAPADPCYHLPCDTDASINTPVLDEMADASATVVAELAGLAD